MIMTVKTIGKDIIVVKNVLCIVYASPRLIQYEAIHMACIGNLCAEGVKGLFKEIIMEDEENDSKEDK